MTKPGFFEDTFEKLVELGSSTGKKTTQALGQTFSPLKIIEKIFGQDENENRIEKKKEKKKSNHTPLNLKDLQEKYAQQDKEKETALKNRLFQLVKQGEEKVLQKKKQEEEKRKIIEEKEKEEKERQARLKAQQQVQQEEPKGKVRLSIFSPKKMAQKKHVETKPAVGKQ